MPVDFNRLIEQHLRQDKVFQKTVGRYYPSEAGNCLRKSWYSYKYPQPASPKRSKHFYLGALLHDFMAEVLESPKNKEVKLLEKEVPLKIIRPDFTVSGRLDDIFMLTADGRKFILEVKSTNSKLEWMNGPQDSHLMQLQLYLHAHEIKEGVILYLEKSSLESRWFNVSYDPASAEAAIARFALLHGKLKANELPDAEARQRPGWAWLCKGCEYSEMCGRDSGCAATKSG